MTNNHDEKEILSRDAFNLLTKIPDSTDLSSICKRFENLRLVALSRFCST
jgi:nuclear pore complex protein Nup155